MDIRDARERDYADVLVLNEAEVPHVSSLTLEDLSELVPQFFYFRVVWVNGVCAGFMAALCPGQKYPSLNYRWFCERYASFVYIDRIVVSPQFKGMGIGRALYADVERAARSVSPILTCEVNLQPPNPASIQFHREIGFAEVGQLDGDDGKRVSLMVKAVGS